MDMDMDPSHNMTDRSHNMTDPSHGMGDSSGDMASGNLDGAHGMMMDHMMSPFLFTRMKQFFVLFEGAFITSTGGFVGALLLSALFAFAATVFSQVIRIFEARVLRGNSSLAKLVASMLYGVRQALHYFAMLLVMTMNVWVILAVLVGHVLGWLFYTFALHRRLAGKRDVGDDVVIGSREEAVGCEDC